MDKLEFVSGVRRELRAVLRLAPWVLVSLLLAAVLWRTDLAAVSGLFQSPPEATATSELPPPPPTEESTAIPTETPTAEPAVELPTDTPTPEATLAPTETPTLPPTATTEPSLTPGEVEPTPAAPTEAVSGDSRYDENADLAFDWGTLFDSAALGVSYLWLCCGILLLFAVPVVFAVLWVAGKRREAPEE